MGADMQQKKRQQRSLIVYLPQKFLYEPNAWHAMMSLYKVHLHFCSSRMLEMSMARGLLRRNTVISFDFPYYVCEASARVKGHCNLVCKDFPSLLE